MSASPRNALALAAMKVFPQLASLALFLIAARVFNQADFGVFSLTTVIVALLSQLTYVGFFEYAIKHHDDAEALDVSRTIALVFGLLLGAATWVVAPFLAEAFRSPAMTDLLRALSWMPLAVALTTIFMSKLYSEGRYVVVASTVLVAEIAGLVAAIAALAAGWGLWAFVVQRVATNLVLLPILWSRARWRPRLRLGRRSTVGFLRFGSPMGIDHIIGFFALYLGDILLGLLAGPALAGVYRFGARIVAAAVALLTDPARTLAWVRFAQEGRGRDLSLELADVQGYASFLFAACLAGLAAIAQPLVTLAAGPDWAPAAMVIMTHSLVWLLMMPLNIAIEPALGMRNATHYLPLLRGVFAVTSFIAISLTAARGVEALALAIVLPGVLQAVLLMGVARVRFGVSILALIRTNLPVWTSAGVMFLAILGARPFTSLLLLPWQILAEIGVGMVLFIALTFLINRRYFDFFAGLATSRLRRPAAAGSSPEGAPPAGADAAAPDPAGDAGAAAGAKTLEGVWTDGPPPRHPAPRD